MNSPKLLVKAFPFIFIFIAILIFFYPVWLKGQVPLPADLVVGSYLPWLDYKWGYEVGVPVKNPITSDAISFSYPMRTLAIDLMKSGQWPLWNPYILFGTPLLANFQSGAFTLTNLVYFLTDKLTAWSIQIMLQHFLAAIFTYFLLRHWKVGKIGSVFGGIIFAFSGFNLIWSQWNAHSLGSAFIPLIILFSDLLLTRGKLFYGALLSLSIAFQIFAGYPQIMFYSLLVVSILFSLRLREVEKLIPTSLSLLFFISLGFSLAAIQLLPGYELTKLSQRSVESIPVEWAFLSWEQIITFIAPDYFGNHATNNYWGPKNYTSNIGFVGVIAVVLAGFSVALFKRVKEVRMAIFIALISLVLALPNPLSIFLWESNLLGMGAGVSHRSLVLFNLAVALLVGFGIDAFLNKEKGRLVLSYIFPGLTLISFAVYSMVFFVLGQRSSDTILSGLMDQHIIGIRNLIFPLFLFLSSIVIVWIFGKRRIIGISILLVLMIFELFRFGWKFTPFSPRHIVYPKTPVLEFLSSESSLGRVNGASVIPTNLMIPYKIQAPGGYDAVYPVRTAKFIGVLNSNDSEANAQDRYGNVTLNESNLLNLTNTTYLLVKNKDNYDEQRFTKVFEDGSVRVLENNNVLPRAFMVFDWETKNDNKIFDSLLEEYFPLGRKIILEEDLTNHSVSSSGSFETNYIYYGDQESLLHVSTTNPGMLFVSDTFYPDWKASLDGKETKIYRANYNFRAVSIPEGVHEVKFSYYPESFYNGMKITLFSLFTIAAIIIYPKLFNGKKH